MDVRDITPVTPPREARTAEPVLERYNPTLRHWEPVSRGATECPSEHCDVRVASDTPLEPRTRGEAAPGNARRAEGSSDGGGRGRRPHPLQGELPDPLIGSAALQRRWEDPGAELARLHALVASHERRLGPLMAHRSPVVARAATRLWASLRHVSPDVLGLLAAMDEAAAGERQLAEALDALAGLEDGR